MEGGNSFQFKVTIEINQICIPPFITSGSVTSPLNINIDSNSKMQLPSYDWTLPDSSCADINYAITGSSLLSID